MASKQQLKNIGQTWEQFHKTHSDHSRNRLMENYRHLVKYAAERVHSKLPSKVELDDLISAGTFGLMDAIEAYDPERGVKFETYCLPRIKGSILDELRSMDWVPRLVRTRAHQLSKATQSLEVSLGRKPTIKETAEELNMNMVEFNRLRRDANAVNIVTRAERLIVVLYYYEEMTMKEIGTTLDLSESRVSQMHSSIVQRLKAQLDTRKKEFAI